MRFAVSPLWEITPSFRLLTSAPAHAVHRIWVDQVRPRMAAAGLDRGPLCDLIPPSGYVPDFLNPAPSGPAPALASELAAIRAASPDRVRRDLDHLARHQGRLGPGARALHADPHNHLPRVTEAIEAYWELAIAPYWARIRTLLDADVLHRARQVAERGANHLFSDLHTSISWDDSVLRLARRKHSLSRSTSGSGLVLIPSAFGGPGLRTRTAPPEPPQLSYPARGTGLLWESRPATRPDALASVVGRSRALLLSELDTPASTTELAHRTGLSAAGVSQCLTALRDAGLVSAHRVGRSVLYARTAAAETLLEAASG
ncbi:DUF5937 family protein [Streptomyces sp. NPDC048462]|uniref:ArsR/SmtB family transcription factor n=1 Tax=Streptomyces sp. NPDC048462 TaxID=3365555 RepID=UPI00371E49F2